MDLYASGRQKPKSPSDSAVDLTSKNGYILEMLVTRWMRSRVGYATGLWYFCVYGYTDTSFQIRVDEEAKIKRYEA